MSFAQNLAAGKVGEGLIAKWLMTRGNAVLPVYEIEKSEGKGPQLFSLDAEHVAPDMVVFKKNGVLWVEAKHKSVFTWHRISQEWLTGIDLRHYEDYQRVAAKTNLPVWLLFFHRESEPSSEDKRHGCPPVCPTGLFGGNMGVLREHHRTPSFNPNRDDVKGHGRSGMIYWAESSLRRLATKAEITGQKLTWEEEWDSHQ